MRFVQPWALTDSRRACRPALRLEPVPVLMLHLRDSLCVLLSVVALAAIAEMQTADSPAPDHWKNFHHVRHFGRRVARQGQDHEQVPRKSFFFSASATERRARPSRRYLESGTTVVFPSSSFSCFFHQQTFQMASGC